MKKRPQDLQNTRKPYTEKDFIQKSYLQYTRGITPKRVTSGGAHAQRPRKRKNVKTVQSCWRQFQPAREPNRRPPAPVAIFLRTASNDQSKAIAIHTMQEFYQRRKTWCVLKLWTISNAKHEDYSRCDIKACWQSFVNDVFWKNVEKQGASIESTHKREIESEACAERQAGKLWAPNLKS